MVKNSKLYDVFISFDRRDVAKAREIADIMRSFDLSPFPDDFDAMVESPEDLLWDAMSLSRALVVVVPNLENPTSKIAFEVGASKAWNKPIYLVASSAPDVVPVFLRDAPLFPFSRANEVAASIIASAKPLTDFEVDTLGNVYSTVGVAADQLLLEPSRLEQVVKNFNKKSGREMAGEELMSHLLRLRKQGKLPQLSKR